MGKMGGQPLPGHFPGQPLHGVSVSSNHEASLPSSLAMLLPVTLVETSWVVGEWMTGGLLVDMHVDVYLSEQVDGQTNRQQEVRQVDRQVGR